MILKSLRVENFKCIEDSGEFSIEKVTCMVGKNESGKTALLQALYKLKPAVESDSKFEDLEYPRRKWSEYKERQQTKPDNILTTIWELEGHDIEAIANKYGSKALKSNSIEIEKGYNNVQYWNVDIDEKEVLNYYLKSADLYGEELSPLEKINTISEVINSLSSLEPPSDRQSALLNKLKEDFPEQDPKKAAINILDKQLPIFLYFADYQKMPGEVSINQLMKKIEDDQLTFADRVFLALLDLAGTKLEEISEIGKFERLIAELEAVSNRLSDEIFEYWSQNKHLEVEFRFDAARPQDPPPLNEGFIFRTRIRNRRHGVTVSFDERSAGFVWFFSFLVWFSQVRKNYGEKLFILLDEPALSLHARAQADFIRYINEELKPHYQVIYTSHYAIFN